MKSLTLELSLKPFCGLDAAGVRAVCRDILRQWEALARPAERLAIMLWAADGSEILEYSGDLDAPMEWARYLGNANPHMPVPADPEQKSLHARNYLFRPDAGLITYRRLAEIVRGWREVAREAGREIEVGATFDPGGEFAPSKFKYERHREICLSNTMGRASFVCCYGRLKADTHRYAGYPEGIPAGTSIGSFLGRQFDHFARDLGFDFLWLSNGFGFGLETWKTIGPLFDGARFHPERARQTADAIVQFWRDFRAECPRRRVRTRGTNLGTGTDLASDATPLRELYTGGFDFDPPPNSPWAAINGDFGIELAGYQSRIAELPPGADFPFRFYLHDPWWLNSPWIDRYEGQPHDIYLPLSIGRVTAEGGVQVPEHLLLLTIDDSHGARPERVPTESTPHLLRAWRERPDAPGPFVWLYPFDELHDTLFGPTPAPERLFHTDWFAREAINDGLPLNTVISTRAFDRLGRAAGDVLAGRILVAPAPLEPQGEERLLAWLERGGALILYGPLDQSPQLRDLLGLEAAAPLEGTMQVRVTCPALDVSPAPAPSRYVHRAVMSGGGLQEQPAAGGALVLAMAEQGDQVRALAAQRTTTRGARLSWLRAPLPLELGQDEHLPAAEPATEVFNFTELVRQTVAGHGWRIAWGLHHRGQRRPVLTIHRQDNGWFFSGYVPDTTVEVRLESPFGRPLLLGAEAALHEAGAAYHLPRAWRHECRVFINQRQGTASAVETCPAQVGVSRRLLVRGLEQAELSFFPPVDAGPVTLWSNPAWPYIGGESVPLERHATPHGLMLRTLAPVSGTALLSW